MMGKTIKECYNLFEIQNFLKKSSEISYLHIQNVYLSCCYVNNEIDYYQRIFILDFLHETIE